MKKILLLSLAILISNCAGSYKPILPPSLTYPTVVDNNGIKYSYRYNVLADAGNKKYAKKEQKKAVKVIAIKLENNTGRTLNFKRDIDIYMGDQVVLPMEPEQVRQNLKQPAALYLLWSPLIFYTEDCRGFDCDRTTIPIGLAIGVANTVVASSANKNLGAEMAAYDILNSDIRDGETVHGLIAISSLMTSAIELRLK